jgi:hypothetical protein
MDIAKLIVDLSNPNKKLAAMASADLASRIWAGSIDEATLVQWLVGCDSPGPTTFETLAEFSRTDGLEIPPKCSAIHLDLWTVTVAELVASGNIVERVKR